MRKLILTGFILLISQHLVLLRLILALLLTMGHGLVLQHFQPYAQPSTAYFATGTSFTLACTFLAALLIVEIEDDRPDDRDIENEHGFADAFPLTVVILCFNFFVAIVGVGMLLHQLRVERLKHATFRVRDTELMPTLTLDPKCKWHLFLSHNW